MTIMNKAPIRYGDHRYHLEFVSKYNDDEDLYNFIKSHVDGRLGGREVILVRLTNEEIDIIYRNIVSSWNFYKNIYEHRTPISIVCKFNKYGIFRYFHDKNHIPRPTDIFDMVSQQIQYCEATKYGFPRIGSDTYDRMGMDAGPLYRINIWVDINKTVIDYKEEIKAMIEEYNNRGE